MFPKAVQNIIEAYSEDMSILEGLQKIKFRQWVIDTGDETFLLYEDLNILEALHKSEKAFWKSPAGWLRSELFSIEKKRMTLWYDIGFQIGFYFPFSNKLRSMSEYLSCYEENQYSLYDYRQRNYWWLFDKHNRDIVTVFDKNNDYLIGP